MVVGAATRTINPGPWATSLRASAYEGRIVLVTGEPTESTTGACAALGVDVVTVDDPMCQPILINRRRRLWFANLIADLGQDDEWVVATDVRDLYFQADPVKWLEENAGDYDLVLSSEGIAYEHEPWNRSAALSVYGRSFYEKNLSKRRVINAGLVAGRAQSVKELFQEICFESSHRPGHSDQIVLNAVLAQNPGRWMVLVTTHADGWGCHGSVMADPLAPAETVEHRRDPIPLVAGDVVAVPNGKPYVAVHQYDRVPEWGAIVSKRLSTIELSSKK